MASFVRQELWDSVQAARAKHDIAQTEFDRCLAILMTHGPTQDHISQLKQAGANRHHALDDYMLTLRNFTNHVAPSCS